MADSIQKRKLGDIYEALGPEYKTKIDRIVKHNGIFGSESELVDEDLFVDLFEMKEKIEKMKEFWKK
jgi:Arc/MetJ-type ribon-helix-helix transcriptional regulator